MLLRAAQSVRGHNPTGTKFVESRGPGPKPMGGGFMTLGRAGRRSRIVGHQQQQVMVSALIRWVGASGSRPCGTLRFRWVSTHCPRVIRVVCTDARLNMRETSEVSAAASGTPVSTTARRVNGAKAESPHQIYYVLDRIFLSARDAIVNATLLFFSQLPGMSNLLRSQVTLSKLVTPFAGIRSCFKDRVESS
ncbi:MAG: hypothetical protein JWP89_4725 [Schlesneria sp.]|nr:hypothetical protein [Schlesneria sp.]